MIAPVDVGGYLRFLHGKQPNRLDCARDLVKFTTEVGEFYLLTYLVW